jgi:hypothetical protein
MTVQALPRPVRAAPRVAAASRGESGARLAAAAMGGNIGLKFLILRPFLLCGWA